MWLSRLGRAAFGAKQVYTLVFFVALTWNVVRTQFGKGKKEWQENSRPRLP